MTATPRTGRGLGKGETLRGGSGIGGESCFSFVTFCFPAFLVFLLPLPVGFASGTPERFGTCMDERARLIYNARIVLVTRNSNRSATFVSLGTTAIVRNAIIEP
uniref:Uncharacterized protein n=1 Tax=Setaria viridis TaxID=4556 RepID=A0A4U6UZA4_SETVI|nr:hypothetical protein SEVIR_4G109000v2 [Setaria viridis]